MADILIKGLHLPEDWEMVSINIDRNGKVTQSSDLRCEQIAEAVIVPPHGRLIEESKILDIVIEWCPDDDGSAGKVGDLREMLDEIEALPTVIPASEKEE